MSYQSDQIIFFKLSSGEEIVAQFIESDGANTYFVKNALQVQIVPINGQVSVQTIPFPMLCDEGKPIRVNKASIMVESSNVSQDFINQYNEKYGSGIQVVPSFNPGTLLHS